MGIFSVLWCFNMLSWEGIHSGKSDYAIPRILSISPGMITAQGLHLWAVCLPQAPGCAAKPTLTSTNLSSEIFESWCSQFCNVLPFRQRIQSSTTPRGSQSEGEYLAAQKIIPKGCDGSSTAGKFCNQNEEVWYRLGAGEDAPWILCSVLGPSS